MGQTAQGLPKPRRSRVGARLWRSRYVYLMLLPVMAYFIIFKYWPMYWIRMAFYDYKLLKGFEGSKLVYF